EALIMASIVEKETGIPEERPRVASVFINRLRQGIKLQTDPTVIYGLTKGQGILGRGLRQSELRGNTPYNTYVIDGLPPTPIANPGRESIAAALNPETTDYLFFVADGTGGHAFARTLAEHNDNVAKWRAIEAQQGSGN
ncbi:MAG: endolytic transglycosylase MltG, partial [Rhodobacteraceae bacterium]|nr:endolytic transglycosylase MltG [Paracoccaceae bacterium]